MQRAVVRKLHILFSQSIRQDKGAMDMPFHK